MVGESEHHAHSGLERTERVITGCALAIAETATIVLDGGPNQGTRRNTLILVRTSTQVIASVPRALA